MTTALSEAVADELPDEVALVPSSPAAAAALAQSPDDGRRRPVEEPGLDLADPGLDLGHSVHGTSSAVWNRVPSPGPAGDEVVDGTLLGGVLGVLQRDLVALAQLLQALGALRGRRPLRADELGLLRLRGRQGARVGRVGRGRAHQRHAEHEVGRRQHAGEDRPGQRRLVLGGPAVGVGGGVRGLGRGGRRGPLLGAAQLEDRLQPEGGALHEPLTIRCSHSHDSAGGVDSPIGCCRNDSIAGASCRARSTRASVPDW